MVSESRDGSFLPASTSAISFRLCSSSIPRSWFSYSFIRSLSCSFISSSQCLKQPVSFVYPCNNVLSLYSELRLVKGKFSFPFIITRSPIMSKCFLRLKIPCIIKPYGIIAFMEVFNRILSLRGHHVGKFLIEMFPGIRTSETACTCQVAALPLSATCSRW